MTYDKLVVGIGAVPNTLVTCSACQRLFYTATPINTHPPNPHYASFGVPGVKEHAFFLKEAEDGR